MPNGSPPALSVVATVYNREHCILRCLQSVLRQDYRDYELLVVDDGSSDNSAGLVAEIAAADARVRLIRHPVNRGVSAARTTGFSAARAEWIVSIDSDDELLPGALAIVKERLYALKPPIHAAGFQCVYDDGSFSPDPPVDAVLDYAGYLRFSEAHHGGRSDVLNAVRRSIWKQLTDEWKFGDRDLEDMFLLNFYRKFEGRFWPTPCLLVHIDSDNRLNTAVRRSLKDNLPLTKARIQTSLAILSHHGEALRRHAPRLYHRHTCRLAVMLFAVGDRRSALAYSFRAVRTRPLHPRSWAVPAIGLLGEAPLHWARTAAQRCMAMGLPANGPRST